jgi:hypothetical protein
MMPGVIITTNYNAKAQRTDYLVEYGTHSLKFSIGDFEQSLKPNLKTEKVESWLKSLE